MAKQNLRGMYVTLEHDIGSDWDFLRAWQPSVLRLMLQGVDVDRIQRVHETCPEAQIILRFWHIDDADRSAQARMKSDPIGEADRQADWWAQAFDKIGNAVPRDLLLAGAINEPVPHEDGPQIRDHTARFLTRNGERGIRSVGYFFSVGTPPKPGEHAYDWDYFAEIEQEFVDTDSLLGIHEYMQPEGMYFEWVDDEGNERIDYGNLIGRHLSCPMKRVKKVIAEWGVDGLIFNRHPDPRHNHSGWRNFPNLWSAERYADEYVECVRKADPTVIGICPFLLDSNADQWHSFEMRPAQAALLQRKHLCERTMPDVDDEDDDHTVYGPTVGSGKRTGKYYIAAPVGLNVRKSPTTDGELLHTLTHGTRVKVTGWFGDWAQLNDLAQWVYRGQRGEWLSNTEPEPLPTVVDPEPQPTEPDKECWARAYPWVLKWEGGWADHPSDPGGATMKGITIGTYTRWREAQGQPQPTKTELRNISDGEVEAIYREWYWKASGADKLPWPLCLAHFDTAVNGGVERAQDILQRSEGDFLRYMGILIDWYTRINNFETFGRAWIRRRAEILLEASTK